MEVGKYRLLCGVLNTLLMGVSLSLILISHYPSSFDTARTPTTRASTLVLARVLLSLSLQDHADARDTSEHIGARSCPHLSLFKTVRMHRTSEHISARSCPCFSLFDTARTHRTRASTLVLARVLYVLIPVPSTPWGHRGHERALMCSLVSLSLSLRHCADAQDTSEHISARSCPCLSLFDTARTHRTRASTSVLARVLVSLSSALRGRTGHE